MKEEKANASSDTQWTTLKGKFFHALNEDGYVNYQGIIVDTVGEDIAIVLFFSWLTGDPTYHKAVWVSDIVEEGWVLYNNGVAWQEAYNIGLVKARPQER